MTLSSTAERPRAFSGSAYTSSSSLRSSRLKSDITPLILEAHEGNRAFRHLAFPWVLRCERWEPIVFLLKSRGTLGKLKRLLGRQCSPLGRDCRCNMPQAFLAHGLSQDSVSLSERIDAVNQVNIEFANIHRKPSHTLNQCRVHPRLVAIAPGALLRLLGEIERGNSVLANCLLVFSVKLGILVLDNLPHTHLR